MFWVVLILAVLALVFVKFGAMSVTIKVLTLLSVALGVLVAVMVVVYFVRYLRRNK